jgi:hypothetical protein
MLEEWEQSRPEVVPLTQSGPGDLIRIRELTEKGQPERLLFELTQLAEYGVFVVPGGELESWLKSARDNG